MCIGNTHIIDISVCQDDLCPRDMYRGEGECVRILGSQGVECKGLHCLLTKHFSSFLFSQHFPFDHSKKEPKPLGCRDTDWRWLLRKCSDNPTPFAVIGPGERGLH